MGGPHAAAGGQGPLSEERPHTGPRALVELAAHLVEGKVRGLHGEGRREGEPLGLAAGELRARLCRAVREPDGAEGPRDAARDLLRGEPEVPGAEGHVLPHRGAEDARLRVLGDEAHGPGGPEARRPACPDGRTVHHHPAAPRGETAVQRREERALARAVAPHEAEVLARPHGQGGVLHRPSPVLAVGEPDGPRLEHVPPLSVGRSKERGPEVTFEAPLVCRCRRGAYSASSVFSATGSTLVGAAAFFTGSLTSSMMAISALSPLRGPSFMMRV